MWARNLPLWIRSLKCNGSCTVLQPSSFSLDLLCPGHPEPLVYGPHTLLGCRKEFLA